MHKLLLGLTVLLGVGLTSCGTANKSCLIVASSVNVACTEYTGAIWAGQYETVCTALGGTLQAACPTDLSFGVCVSQAGTASEVKSRTYTGNAAAQEAACTGSAATWTAD